MIHANLNLVLRSNVLSNWKKIISYRTKNVAMFLLCQNNTVHNYRQAELIL